MVLYNFMFLYLQNKKFCIILFFLCNACYQQMQGLGVRL